MAHHDIIGLKYMEWFEVDILEGLPSRPDETSYVAAKRHNQYAYYTKALTPFTGERTGKMEYMVEAKVDTGNEFDTLVGNLDSTMNRSGPSSKPRPLLAMPNNKLTGNDKVKADWMEDVEWLEWVPG